MNTTKKIEQVKQVIKLLKQIKETGKANVTESTILRKHGYIKPLMKKVEYTDSPGKYTEVLDKWILTPKAEKQIKIFEEAEQ